MDEKSDSAFTVGEDGAASDQLKLIVYHAARDGNLSRLKVFLERRDLAQVSALINTKTFNTPPLVIASRENRIDVVKYLVDKGADLNLTGEVKFDGETIESAPSIWAASAAGHLEVVEALVNAGADVNQTTTTNSSAVRGACFDGHIEIVKFLVDHGADIEIANRHGHTPLMIAAYRNKIDIVRYLLSRGANVNRRSSRGNTCLHDAAEAGSVRIVEELLSAGALIQRDGHRMTPMLSAALIGHRDVVEYFAEIDIGGVGEVGTDSMSDESVVVADGVETDQGTDSTSDLPTDVTSDLSTDSSPTTSRSYRLTAAERRSLQHEIDCGLHERADSLKLLGATCVDKRRDTVSALQYWRRAVVLQAECKNKICLEAVVPPHPLDKSARTIAYGDVEEVACVEDVDAVNGDTDAAQMQALIIRERILGAKHPETFYFLRYRGAIHADQGRYDRCYELWMYALQLQQKALAPLNVMTLISISAFVEIFGYMINDYVLAVADGSMTPNSVTMGVDLPSFTHITQVLHCAVHEVRRHRIGDMPPSLIEDDVHLAMCEDCAPREPTIGLHRLAISAIQLTALIGRLDIAAHPTADDTALVKTLLKRLLCMLQSVGKSHQTIMHLACADNLERNDPTSVAQRNGSDIRLPSLYVVRTLLAIGAPFDCRDDEGRTPLHIATSNKHHRRYVIQSLLEAGAHIDNRSNDKQTPMIMLKERGEKIKNGQTADDRANNASFLPINPLNYRNLQCLASEVVAKNQLDLSILPETLREKAKTH